jgi:translation initiation factor 1A
MKKQKDVAQEDILRVKLPKDREVIGVLEQRLGASRNRVKCLDAVSRICRIPGRLKRSLWVREGDIVLVEPWEYDNNKGDIIYKYRQTQVEWLKKKGYLKGIEESEEF